MSSNALPPSGAPPRRRTSPIVWILAVIGGLFVLMIIVSVGSGLYIAHKARQAGVDSALMERDPELAVAKMMAALAPNMDLVSIDRERRVVTMRSRRTGKTVTFSLDDARKGRIAIEGEDGARVFGGGGGGGGRVHIQPGGAVTLPEWLPGYTGATPRGAQSTQDGVENGTFEFRTEDSPKQVLDFYEAALRKAGMAPNVMREADGGMVSARDQASRREAMVTVERRGGSTVVSGTFSSGK